MKLLLIGAGNMGGAMLKGLHVHDITVVEASKDKTDILKKTYPTLKVVNSIPKLDDFIVILAIKPQSLDALHVEGKAKGLISILAGVSLEKLQTKIAAKSYVRAMPNMAALVQKSATSLCGDEDLKENALEILSSVGKCFWLESENELDIATGLAGSAPAWIALVAEALSDGAVNLGLKREITYKYIAQLFEGVGEVLQNEHPALLKDKVTSPKGTTIAGLTKLEEGGVRDSFIKAIEASYERTKKL
ncbi:pyrroline-5-carboxylate reductase [Sulfurospirillum arcachonense]|uniref:pyrroline-5-carboxylate reductase n=1 Tax=Sulfurospirillum arcachonense TaxID=57666 RepID=UPI0004680B43|nr:pyrroline-5-carboxylate reductase [Sulfurospirillum arcachonense]